MEEDTPIHVGHKTNMGGKADDVQFRKQQMLEARKQKVASIANSYDYYSTE